MEKRELQQEINEIVNRLDSVPAKLHNNYLKRTDINDFNNYKLVMRDLKIRHEKAQANAPDAKLLRQTPLSMEQLSPMNKSQASFSTSNRQQHRLRMFSAERDLNSSKQEDSLSNFREKLLKNKLP